MNPERRPDRVSDTGSSDASLSVGETCAAERMVVRGMLAWSSRLRTILIPVVLAMAACTTVRTFGMRWELTTKGFCKAPGIDPRYAVEQEVTLRYEKTPNHYAIICSNKLAATLKAGGQSIVPMVQRRNGGHGSSTSICEIAGLKDDAPGTECTFQGQVLGGFEGDGKPTPWD
jgi:hypothetical protein